MINFATKYDTFDREFDEFNAFVIDVIWYDAKKNDIFENNWFDNIEIKLW